jgi:hypothetical protein
MECNAVSKIRLIFLIWLHTGNIWPGINMGLFVDASIWLA